MFKKDIKLFNLLGFEVKIDLSWLIIAALIVWSLATGLFPFHYKNLSTRTYWLMGLTGAIGLFVSIVIHELSHSIVARKFGIPMKGITLFIFGGVAEMSDEPRSPRAEFMMAIVGPLSSIAIALILYVLHTSLKGSISPPINGVVLYLAWINGILAFFNLIPAFPLDGGRVLRAVLWKIKGSLQRATRISSQIGSGFGIGLIILGVFNIFRGNFVGGMWWVLIGMFLQGAAKMSYQQMVIRKSLEGESLDRFMKTDPITAPSAITLQQLVDDYIYEYHYKMFPVLTDGNQLAGCITTRQVKAVPREEWAQTTVGDVAERCSEDNTISPKSDAVKALETMHRTGSSRLMVVGEDKKLVGIISLKDMMKWLALKIDLDLN